MSKYENGEEHESYGLVSFSRRQGVPGRLFGSSLPEHHHYITLSVKKGSRVPSGSGLDHFYGAIVRGDIVEVDMSAAQFAELITSLNMGLGVPCTIRAIEGRRLEKPPEVKLESEKVTETFHTALSGLQAAFRDLQSHVETALAEKTISKKDKGSILSKMSYFATTLQSNLPYIVEIFEESMDKIKTSTKSELESWITYKVMQKGFQNLLDKNFSPTLTEEASPPESDAKLVPYSAKLGNRP